MQQQRAPRLRLKAPAPPAAATRAVAGVVVVDLCDDDAGENEEDNRAQAAAKRTKTTSVAGARSNCSRSSVSSSSSSSAAAVEHPSRQTRSPVIPEDDDDDANGEASKGTTASTTTRQLMNHEYRRFLLDCLEVAAPMSCPQPACARFPLLSPQAQTIFARLVFLPNPWFRKSDAMAYLTRAGESESNACAAFEQLTCDQVFVRPPADEDEWMSVLESTAVSKQMVMDVARSFGGPATKTTMPSSSAKKGDTVRALRNLFYHTPRIFNASPVPVAKRVRDRLTGEVFCLTRDAFRTFRDAILAAECFLEARCVGADGDALDVRCIWESVRVRGARPIPAAFSPGFHHGARGVLVSTLEKGFAAFPSAVRIHMDAATRLGFHTAIDALHVFSGLSVSAFTFPERYLSFASSTLSLHDSIRAAVARANVSSVLDSYSLHSVDSCVTFARLCLDWAVLGAARIDLPEPPHVRMHHNAVCIMFLALTRAVDFMEQHRRYEDAVHVLSTMLASSSEASRTHAYRGAWYNRLTIDLDHVGRRDEARRMCEMALGDSHLDPRDAHLFSLKRRFHASSSSSRASICADQVLSSSLQLVLRAPVESIYGTPFPNAVPSSSATRKAVGRKLHFIHPDEDTPEVTIDVEHFALNHYSKSHGWYGWHSENFPMHTLFRMFMSQALEAHVPGVSFRDTPLDLLCRDGLFYSNRKDLIDQRVASIRAMTPAQLAEVVRDKWTADPVLSHRDRSRARRYGVPLNGRGLQLICCCLGSAALARLCEAFCKHYFVLGTGGAPDLVLVRPSPLPPPRSPQCRDALLLFQRVFSVHGRGFEEMGEEEDCLGPEAFPEHFAGEIKFVEVKSEHDILSDKQIGWLNMLHELRVDCAVLKVTSKV